MGNKNTKDSAKLSILTALTEDNKRWLVFGIALNHVLVPLIRPILEQEILQEYNDLKTSHGIDVQTSHSFPFSRYPNVMKYENINANDTKLKPPHYKKLDYSKFNYEVTSHVDFAKLFLQNHMAKFNAFNETCDASAVLNLLGRIPVFSVALQTAANVVREGRNAWGHCNFTDWNETDFKARFWDMKQLVKEMGLPSADESKVITDLKDWEDKGVILCMNATIDAELAKVVRVHVSQLSCDVEKMAFETQEEFNDLRMLFKNIQLCVHEWVERITKIELDQDVLQQNQSSIAVQVDQLTTSQGVLEQEQSFTTVKVEKLTTNQDVLQQEQSSTAVKVDQLTNNQEVLKQEQNFAAVKVDQLTTNQEVVQQEQSSTAAKVDQLTTNQIILEERQSITTVKVDQLEIGQKAVEERIIELEGHTSSLDFSCCEADINYYFERYDSDTRQWLLNNFDAWFKRPSESRAYVLLGDAAIGKSVMAAVITQRASNDGNLAAAYFCRHYDGTRRDPRYLLGTIAHQLRNCKNDYDRVMGGDTGIQKMLANGKLGVQELFTKLLEEPLSKCSSGKRQLVVIDALDETEYWSREDFLDLIMNRFPQLPKWLVFFITSRPEHTVELRLETYNPCIRICAGNSECADFYQQHELDIRRFLVKRLDFSILPYSAEDLTKKCSGMFLYAFYIVEFLKNPTWLDGDILPLNINTFFYNNFKRVHEKIGSDLYKKLFGCSLVAPSPLPVSFISFILHKDNSTLDEQEVIDIVSQFVAWRKSERTFAFLHNLIPAWLTDKARAPPRLLIDKNRANAYFQGIIIEFLNSYLKDQKEFLLCESRDLVDYVLGNGILFLCHCNVESSGSSEIIFHCLTNYRFLQHRIRSKIGIYSLIKDFKFSIARQTFNKKKKHIVDDICSAIEQEKDVIAGNPELLYSCLRNESKLCHQSVISSNVSAAWMELELDLSFYAHKVLRNMMCGAFSHDKKLFAGGKYGCIYLYDASSFRKMFGPFEIMSEGAIIYLEFSPDDKFVFFGRLDAWFSVQERRVVEITQFSGNPKYYEWASFIYDGKFIAVSQELLPEKHTYCCFVYIFYEWIVKEFDLGEVNTRENVRRKFSSFRIGHLKIGAELVHSLLNLVDNLRWIRLRLCSSCAQFEFLQTPVRDRIVLLYADIFEYQIWNVHTGRPVIAEMFSSRVKLKPFFYLWHFFPTMNAYVDAICAESITLGNVAVLSFLFFIDRLATSGEIFDRINFDKNFSMQGIKSTYFFWNTPVECCNYILSKRLIPNCSLSKNGMWLAWYGLNKIKLYEMKIVGFLNWWFRKGLFDYRQDLDQSLVYERVHAFASDSSILLYITRSENQDRTVCALSFDTGIKLQSTWGSCPVSFESEDGHTHGYIFFGSGEKRTVLLRDLPWNFLRDLVESHTDRINVAFTSTGRVTLVCSNATYMSLEITDGAWKTALENVLNNSSQQIHVEKCVFSNDGKLLAVHESCQLLLFHDNKFLCSVFKLEENCKHTITCVTFSPDNSLLSFYIQKGNNVQSFYVWDVRKRLLFGPISIPYIASVDCCCISSDNTKLILCNAFSVFILKDPPRFGRYSKFYHVPNVINYRTSQLCAHCTVSSDDKLLACCIANEIIIFQLNGPDTFWRMPQNHLGRKEFCKFLKGNRYLISYGIDCVVVLFDISKWKSVAYTRLPESIISLAVSPDEEKIVCLKYSGGVSIVKLHGLKYGLPSNFQLPSSLGFTDRSHELPGVHLLVPPIQTEFEQDEMMSADDFCESSDGYVSDEMYVESDHSEDQINEDRF